MREVLWGLDIEVVIQWWPCSYSYRRVSLSGKGGTRPPGRLEVRRVHVFGVGRGEAGGSDS